MSSTVWPALVLIPLLAAGTAAASDAPGRCTRAISPDSALQVYAAMKDLRGADGCALVDVRTDKDTMRVILEKDGAALPAMEVRPAACAAGAEVTGPEFAVSVPAAAAAQCPTAAAKMKALVTGNALAAASKLDPAPRLIGPRAKIAAGAGAAVLAIAAFGIWRWRRRRRAPAA